MKDLISIWKLYRDLVIMLTILVIFWTVFSISDGNFCISLGFFSYQREIAELTTIEILLIKLTVSLFIVALTFLRYLLKDYSSFFPENLKMNVFFNSPYHTKELLEKTELTAINGLPISTEEIDRSKYFTTADKVIKTHFEYNNFFKKVVIKENGTLQSIGDSKFFIKKIGGIQNYRITDATGNLHHKMEDKKSVSQKKGFSTRFVKADSPTDKVSPSLNIFKKIIICPKFKQYLIINGKNEALMTHELYGVTIIKIFPIPTYSDTLYLFRHKDVLIPIGHASYFEEIR